MIEAPQGYYVRPSRSGFFCSMDVADGKQRGLVKSDGTMKLFTSANMAAMYTRLHAEKGLMPEQEISYDDFRAYLRSEIIEKR